MNPKMHSEMYRSVKTLEVLFRRDESKMDPKKIALILVGVPKSLVLSITGVAEAGFFPGVLAFAAG
jgi:hypothetical protein